MANKRVKVLNTDWHYVNC